jgi:hypothetical protein
MTGQSAGLYMALPADWNPSSARHACCRRDRAPGFQGQLRAATAADGLFYLQAEACGNHFGDLVWALHNCAHQRGATQARLTLPAVDPLTVSKRSPPSAGTQLRAIGPQIPANL